MALDLGGSFGIDVGQIAAGGGIFGSNDVPDPVRDALNRGRREMQKEQNLNSLMMEAASFNQKMQLAKDHGIHPLAMLGVNTSTNAPVVSSGATAGMTASFAKDHGVSEVQKIMDDQQLELNRLAIERQRTALEQDQLELSRAKQPPSPAVRAPVLTTHPANLAGTAAPASALTSNPDILVKPDETTATDRKNYGLTAARHPLMLRATDPVSGEDTYVPNPALNLDPESYGDIATIAANLGVSQKTAMALVAAGLIGGGVLGVGFGAARLGMAGYKAYKSYKLSKKIPRQAWKKGGVK